MSDEQDGGLLSITLKHHRGDSSRLRVGAQMTDPSKASPFGTAWLFLVPSPGLALFWALGGTEWPAAFGIYLLTVAGLAAMGLHRIV